MCSVKGQFVQVWSGEAKRKQRAVDLQYFAGRISSSFGTDKGEECKVYPCRRPHLCIDCLEDLVL